MASLRLSVWASRSVSRGWLATAAVGDGCLRGLGSRASSHATAQHGECDHRDGESRKLPQDVAHDRFMRTA